MKGRYVIIAVIIFFVWHFFGHFLHWYDTVWWSDRAAHFIAGATAGLFWWWLIKKTIASPTNRTFLILESITIITLATTISVFWEFWEFSNWRFQILRETTGQIQKFYYPYLGNNLADICWGLVGGVAIALIYFLVERFRK